MWLIQTFAMTFPPFSALSLFLAKGLLSSQFIKKIMTIRKYFLQPPCSIPIELSVSLLHCKYSGKCYFLIIKSRIYKSVLLAKCLYSLELVYFFLEVFLSLEFSGQIHHFSTKFLAVFSSSSHFCIYLHKWEFTKILILRFVLFGLNIIPWTIAQNWFYNLTLKPNNVHTYTP